jgi:alkanesulfonate monooxygenase SsuD/methylene tetrahydromethanopterin reductase-like flavin-dependent oxidoreductase (luciferase family)
MTMSRRWAVRYDLRAPAIGAPAPTLYRAALDQIAWADRLGADEVLISEHHGSDDGYLPSAATFAAAAAAVTERCRITLAALVLPLLDPVRAAEDTIVVDHISNGRVDVVVALGYVAREFEMFGLSMADRAALLEEKLPVYLAALTGEPFEHRGVTMQVTPPPVQRPRPPVIVGGAAPASARRAARLADGFMPMVHADELHGLYLAECERLGRPAGRYKNPFGPLFVHVTDDPDAAWARIAPHALHEMNAYGRWAAESASYTGFVPMEDPDELRSFGMHAVVTPEECLKLWQGLPDDANLLLHPLMGGLDPDLGWTSLRLFEEQVLPKRG